MNNLSNWKNIAIPELMKEVPKDSRGYPIPYIVFHDKNGDPHFRINDQRKVAECVEYDKCSICGNILAENKWLVGGPLSAFHPQGVFNDIPVHKECCEYALQVCPYMAYTQYKAVGITNSVLNVTAQEGIAIVNPTQDDQRLPLFVMCKIKAFEFKIKNAAESYVVPHKPYLDLRFWNDGIELSFEQATKIINQHYQ